MFFNTPFCSVTVEAFIMRSECTSKNYVDVTRIAVHLETLWLSTVKNSITYHVMCLGIHIIFEIHLQLQSTTPR